MIRIFSLPSAKWLALVLAVWSCGVNTQRDATDSVQASPRFTEPVADSAVKDSVKIAPVQKEIPGDTSSMRILLVGDSQAGGIMYPLNDFCLHNGYKVAAALVWFSATDRTLAGSDTLATLIGRYKPDYIMVVIGLNQVFQTYHNGSRTAVKKIIAGFGKIP